MANELFSGIKAVLRDLPARSDTVKAGGVNQLIPDRRDAQVQQLSEQAKNVDQYKYGESNEERSKRKRRTLEVFARIASVIKTADEGTATWVERSDKYKDEFVPGSKTREEVIQKFVESITENNGTLTLEIYGNSFCPDRSEHSYELEAMKPHERRLFIAIAPKVIAELQRRKGQDQGKEEYRAKAENTILNKLTRIAEGNLDVRRVGKREYSSYSHEAMVALIKIDSARTLKTLERFLLDGFVDIGDKVDILENLVVGDLQDVTKLVLLLSKVDEKGVVGSEKIARALVQKLKSEMKTHIQDNTIVELNGLQRPFGQFTESEKREILSERKRLCTGLLVQMNFGGDVAVATQALTLIPGKLTGEYDKSDRPRIFDVYGDSLSRISGVSETVLRAMPGFVFGKSAVGEAHYTVKTETDVLLAKAGLKKEQNVMNPEARVFITSEFFKGFTQLLKIVSGDVNSFARITPSKLDIYVDSMVLMYRKLNLEDRDKVQLNDWDVSGALNKLPRFWKPKRLERKLNKVGFSKTNY